MAKLDQRIRSARVEAGLTQAALAARIGVTVLSISRWERRVSAPRAGTIGEIARATGKNGSYFFDDDDEEPSPAAPPSVEELLALTLGEFLAFAHSRASQPTVV